MELTFEKEKMSDVFMKHHIRGLPLDMVIHEFTGLDGTHPHDHPFRFRVHVLKGWYQEVQFIITGESTYTEEHYVRNEGDIFIVEASTIHSIYDCSPGGWTTVIYPEAGERDWGFYEFGDTIQHRYHYESEFSPISNIAHLIPSLR